MKFYVALALCAPFSRPTGSDITLTVAGGPVIFAPVAFVFVIFGVLNHGHPMQFSV